MDKTQWFLITKLSFLLWWTPIPNLDDIIKDLYCMYYKKDKLRSMHVLVFKNGFFVSYLFINVCLILF